MTPRGVPSTSPTARLFTAGGVKRRCEMTPRGVRALHLRRGGAHLGGRAVCGRRRAAPVPAHLLKVVRPGRVEGRPPVLPAPAARRDAQGARSREIARDRPRLHDAMLKAVGRAAHAHARGARAGAGAAMGGGCADRCRTPHHLSPSPPISVDVWAGAGHDADARVPRLAATRPRGAGKGSARRGGWSSREIHAR